MALKDITLGQYFPGNSVVGSIAITPAMATRRFCPPDSSSTG